MRVCACLWYSLLRTSSLPPLDWPLPTQFGQYDLKIEVQPKAHHRAHYETEGSRGAVKAASGGHPIVKVTNLGFSLHVWDTYFCSAMSSVINLHHFVVYTWNCKDHYPNTNKLSGEKYFSCIKMTKISFAEHILGFYAPLNKMRALVSLPYWLHFPLRSGLIYCLC